MRIHFAHPRNSIAPVMEHLLAERNSIQFALYEVIMPSNCNATKCGRSNRNSDIHEQPMRRAAEKKKRTVATPNSTHQKETQLHKIDQFNCV